MLEKKKSLTFFIKTLKFNSYNFILNRLLIFISIFSFIIILSSCDNSHSINNDINNNSDNKNISTLGSLIKIKLAPINDSTTIKIRNKNIKSSFYLKKIYSKRNYKPIWIADNIPNNNSAKLMKLFKNSAIYGLDSSFYKFSDLKKLYYIIKNKKISDSLENKIVDFDILLTNSCLLFMSHLKTGVLYPDTLIYGNKMIQFSDAYVEYFNKMSGSKDFKKEILLMQPQTYDYKTIQKGIEKYLQTAVLNRDTFFVEELRKDSTECYNMAKKIIFYYENLLPTDTKKYVEGKINELSNVYSFMRADTNWIRTENNDSIFFNKLRLFQERHALDKDAKIGKNTRDALMKNNYDRFLQTMASLERIRKERGWAKNHVYVNIPTYTLRVVENHKIVKTFRVVVGTRRNKTPTLNSKIEYFKTFPEWFVPFSISTKEILPKIKKDSTYLKRHNYLVLDKNSKRIDVNDVEWKNINKTNFDYYIKQKAGYGNSLGTIKFIFPNKYSVYLHDTPSKRFFKRSVRAYSHGCVRLHNPTKFAEYLLKRDKIMDVDTFRNLMKKRKRRHINLKKQLPIYIRYITCEANDKYNIIFYKDIYKKDKKLTDYMFSNEY